MSRYSLTALGMVNALGTNLAEITERLFSGERGNFAKHCLRTTNVVVPVGQVPGPLLELPPDLSAYQCRNHVLAYLAFKQIEKSVAVLRERIGAERLGVVIGSSTSGIDASEEAFFKWRTDGKLPENYRFKTQHEMGSVSGFIARIAKAKGPAYTLSTACSSSAKVFGSAATLLNLGICDAVIVGGVDTLCHLTLNGFEALSSLSLEISNPMSNNRTGLNIGEGAAFFVLSKEEGSVRLMGVGETSDAHHISAPEPSGAAAEHAIRSALKEANIDCDAIAYVNLHGTGTPQNDAMEAGVIHRVFGNVPTSSTKPLTGHCLGAAGAIEIGFCWLALMNAKNGRIVWPIHHWDGVADSDLPQLNLVKANVGVEDGGPVYVLSNSFAFGGSNCAVVLGKNVPATRSDCLNNSTVHLRSWSGWAPGLPDAASWNKWLLKPGPLTDDNLNPPCADVPPLLRRRCGRLVRFTLETAFAVCKSAGTHPENVHHVHCSRNGEILVMKQLFEALADRVPMSPTMFSNSVHHTPTAYFDLVAKNKMLSRTISAGSSGFACAMLEVAGLLAKSPETAVLLTFADEPPPEPFNDPAFVPGVPFAVAFIFESNGNTGGLPLHFKRSTGSILERTSSDEPLFDFLRWLIGSGPTFQTASGFGGLEWRR